MILSAIIAEASCVDSINLNGLFEFIVKSDVFYTIMYVCVSSTFCEQISIGRCDIVHYLAGIMIVPCSVCV